MERGKYALLTFDLLTSLRYLFGLDNELLHKVFDSIYLMNNDNLKGYLDENRHPRILGFLYMCKEIYEKLGIDGLRAYISLNIMYYIVNLLRVNLNRDLNEICDKISRRFTLTKVREIIFYKLDDPKRREDEISDLAFTLLLKKIEWNEAQKVTENAIKENIKDVEKILELFSTIEKVSNDILGIYLKNINLVVSAAKKSVEDAKKGS